MVVALGFEETAMAAARKPIADFREFIDGVNDARADQYLGGSHSSIVDEEAFNEIQAHLRDYYTGVEPVHSFLDTNGTVFDCIPLAQQYSLRSHKGRLPQPPELPAGFAQPSDDMSKRVIQLHDSFIDRLGNQMYCPDGTIPVQRLTLPWLARFPDLAAFRRKYHARIRRPLPPVMRALPSITALHQYATAEQLAANIGGGAILNVWDPQPVYPPQLMSLSQVWFTSIDRRQTVEAGWQVNPYRYGGNKPVLFTFWTADAYSSTGCYNLTCPAFVQTNNHWMLGGALPDWSSTWGPQIELAVAWHLQGGNWWLYVDGIEVGYFPISIFNHGPMAAGAVRIVCGGETTTTDNTSWAPMGSGELAAAEQFSLVAYQRQIQYIAPGGVTHDANLTVTPNGFPACYTAITTTYPAPWNETLWFGGRPPAACLCT